MNIYAEDRPCPKCGFNYINDRHYPLLTSSPDYGMALHPTSHWSFFPHPEVIGRTCQRCGFEWQERPVDWDELVET